MDAPETDTISNNASDTPEPQGQLNDNPPKKLQGFAAHPENINRAGGPKKEWTMRSLLQEALEEVAELKNKDGQVVKRDKIKRLINHKLARMAVNGDIQAIKEVNNRIDGMPKQTLEATGSINLNVNDFLSKVYGETVIDATATIQPEGDA